LEHRKLEFPAFAHGGGLAAPPELCNAIGTLCPIGPVRAVLVHHSDRGSQYVSIKYTERLAQTGVKPSADSVDDSYDNALAESINGLYKAEVIHRRGPWRSLEAVEFATLEWVDWFNNRRLEPIGNIPPAEAEALYYAAQENLLLAA
ncbi:MAG TPA: integrase core domain-containing protein, partial [Amaricoccus sp.]|uniref:integrase core domain-containing protein n=2 Tax=Amaricoccus sp. TaxID=1872485 RepID=UPI002C2DF55D